MRLTIITGLSGAGRTSSLKVLEDLGCFCADNIPPALIPDFMRIIMSKPTPPENIAIVADLRMGPMFDEIYDVIDHLEKDMEIPVDILFLDASDDALLSRFEQTRRNHPLTNSGMISPGIMAERERLQRIKEMADYVLDTTTFGSRQLASAIERYYRSGKSMTAQISIISFGYKRGIPVDADLMFDVRFIPNPFYLDDLKRDTGLSENVYNYVMSFPITQEFLEKTTSLILELAPHYIEQDKKHIAIAIGCTGGMHRSVAISHALSERLSNSGLQVELVHRDAAIEQLSVLERFPR